MGKRKGKEKENKEHCGFFLYRGGGLGPIELRTGRIPF